MLKTLAYGFVGERGNPETLDRLSASGFLHHPALNQFTLLTGIAAVYYLVALLNQPLYDLELSLDALLRYHLYRELRGNHRQRAQAPSLPEGGVVMWLLETAEVPESPGHPVAVALVVSKIRAAGACRL